MIGKKLLNGFPPQIIRVLMRASLAHRKDHSLSEQKKRLESLQVLIEGMLIYGYHEGNYPMREDQYFIDDRDEEKLKYFLNTDKEDQQRMLDEAR